MRRTVGFLCLWVMLLATPSLAQTREIRNKIDRVCTLATQGERSQADRLFQEILDELPDNRNAIINTYGLFRNRLFYEYALAILDKGAEINTDHDLFYLERAGLCQSMNNYQQAFEYYLLQLEVNPQQYSLVKSRFQTLLLYDVNNSIADEMRIALLQKNQAHPENVEYAQLLLWYALQDEDYDIALAQGLSLDRRLNNQDAQIISIGQICLNNGQYELAGQAFEYVAAKGKLNPEYGHAIIGAIQTEYARCQANPNTERRAYERLSQRIQDTYADMGSGDYPNMVVIHADIMAYHLDQSAEAVDLLSQAIATTQNRNQQCRLKLKLADIYLYNDEMWESTLLYSQVDRTMREEPLGHEARFRNAQLRYFIGEFAWAQAQLDVLKAATSRLIANDAMSLSLIISDNLEYDETGRELQRVARADYKIYQHRDDQALLILDSICADGNAISKPHALCRIAEIKEKNHEYRLADSLYLQVATAFPDSYMADDALMRAALLEHQQLNEREAAKQHYEQLIDRYPTSLYNAQARKNYRKL